MPIYAIQMWLVGYLMVCTSPLAAGIYLPAIWSDNMVIQRKDSVKIHGWNSEYIEHMKIIPGWSRDTIDIQAFRGEWEAWLILPKENGPFEITIQGHETKTIKNVLIGEVWLCSGQSNMRMTVDSLNEGLPGVINKEEIIEAAQYPEIRYFEVYRNFSDGLQEDVKGSWKVCSPETVRRFAAVSYFFGQAIYEHLKVPVGLINACWGGTNIVTWIPEKSINKYADTRLMAAKLPPAIGKPTEASVAYNAMISPLSGFSIKGVIWYQGESNVIDSVNFHLLFPELIHSWRAAWKYEFPFYYVQIPPNEFYESSMSLNYVTETQRQSLAIPRTGMAVIWDKSEIDNLHPRDKMPVGQRLARWALFHNYGFSDISYSGPLIEKAILEKKYIRLYFRYAEKGLIAKENGLSQFEVAGSDGAFKPVKADIDLNTILIDTGKVRDPKFVRFAWGNVAIPNLFNSDGLPASSFMVKID